MEVGYKYYGLLGIKEENLVKRLNRLGHYKIKHTSIGWWIDGACGYRVSDIHDTKKEAIIEAINKIQEVKRMNRFPSWRF